MACLLPGLGVLVALAVSLGWPASLPAQTPQRPVPPGQQLLRQQPQIQLQLQNQIQFQNQPTIQIDPNTGAATYDPIISLMMTQPAVDTNAPLVAEAEFDPPMLLPGARGIFRVVVTSMNDAVQLPDKLPASPGLELVPGGRGQSYNYFGNKMQPRTTINYRVSAAAPGTYVIPAFRVTAAGKTLTVPESRVVVVTPGSGPILESPQLTITFPPGDLYVGQSVPVKISLIDPGDNSAQALSQPQVVSDALLVDPTFARQRREVIERNGRPLAAFTAEVLVTPIREGRHSVLGQAHALVNRVTTSRLSRIGSYNPLFDTDPVIITARRVPTDGELPGYTGAIGTFQVEPPQLSSTSVQAGEPITIRITVRGEGNVGRFTPPRFPSGGEWQAFPPMSEQVPANQLQRQGALSFIFTAIPLSDRVKSTPPIPFAYFDPMKKAYVDITVPPVAITVAPAPAGAPLPMVAETVTPNPEAELNAGQERELVMTGLAETPGHRVGSLVPWQRRSWFLGAALAPGVVLGFLWAWDRRRRYLQANPDVLLRREARRQITRWSREARSAVAARDVPRFVAAAVNALRDACAPHGRANPAALVCRDVLGVLPDDLRDGRGGALVRQLFHAADALRFAGQVPDGEAVLAAHSEFEQLLDRMTARL